MKLEDIKALVTILEGSTLNYMEVTEGDFHLKLGKNASTELAAAVPDRGIAVNAAAPVKSEAVASVEVNEPISPAVTSGTAVKSPMVGVFYAASSPEAEPFVSEGQRVKRGQVLCIIEAMKLMNEITAEKDGVITQICAANGEIVEFGQPLFYIQ